MTNAAAAENLAGREKEKMEKRRALGRGLESLLPGPRVVGAVPKAAVPLEPITIQAVVEEGEPSPVPAKDERNGAPLVSSVSADPRAGASAPDNIAPDADETISIAAQAEARVRGNLVVNLNIS